MTRGRRGRGRGAGTSSFAQMEEDEDDSSLPHEGAAMAGEKTDPVVRPKQTIASGVSREHFDSDILEEIKEFMHHTRSREDLLFEHINELRKSLPRLKHDPCDDRDNPVQSDLLPTATGASRSAARQLSSPTSAVLARGVQDERNRDGVPRLSGQQRPQCLHPGEPRIPEFREGEDPESFFVRFERIARTWGWHLDEWAPRVVTLLAGKALEAYAGMDEDQSDCYDAIKAAVLMKFDVTEESYRQRFRSIAVPAGETVRETYNSIKGLYKRWMRPESRSKEDIGEKIILEQYLRVLPQDVRTWIKEHNPRSGEVAADLAERYFAAHQDHPRQKGFAPKPRYGGHMPQYRTSVDNLSAGSGKRPMTHSNSKHNFVCYYCQQPGHKAALCPLQKPKSVDLCVISSTDDTGVRCNEMLHKHVVDVAINGQHRKALVDTGSSQTLIKSSLLSNGLLNFDKNVTISCVHGCQKNYPTADVTLEIEGQAFMLTVGVLDQLAYDVILGDNLPILENLINQNTEAHKCAVVTRSMAKGLEPLPHVDDDLFEGKCKIRKTRRQKRNDKNKYVGKANELHLVPPEMSFESQWQIPGNFRESQRSDLSLKPLFEKCVVDENKKSTSLTQNLLHDPFVMINNLLYMADAEKPRLVVPKLHRSMILNLGHTIPWAGHLGQAKTYHRIAQHFYWPGLYKDVAEYCKTCHECQMVSPRKVSDRACLQTLPIMDVPYNRIAMDIIGPLPKSSSGHKYTLVLCDYATRYP
uniref:Gypsy retrotransposon integrase-like protein 1 n=1 Tax=Oryzias melastigma TaxID=30732 RepID=A0A3B3D8P6_ORYME